MSIIARLKAGITPKARPQLSQESVLRICTAFGLPWTDDERVRVLAIRGYYRDSMGTKGRNDRGIYDDAIFVVTARGMNPLKASQSKSPAWLITAFNANTDPSIIRKGIATLAPGAYWFAPGRHKISSPSGYEAFRQMSSVTVQRDGGRDDSGHFGINIHKGGARATYSEGCQTLPPGQWEECRDLLYKRLGVSIADVKANPGGKRDWRFKYVLVTREECEQLGVAF